MKPWPLIQTQGRNVKLSRQLFCRVDRLLRGLPGLERALSKKAGFGMMKGVTHSEGGALGWLARWLSRDRLPAETDDPVQVLRKMARAGVRFPLALARVRLGWDWAQGAIVLPRGPQGEIWVAPRILLTNLHPGEARPDAERRAVRHRLINRLAVSTTPNEMAEVLAGGLRAGVWSVEWEAQPNFNRPLPFTPDAVEVMDRLPPRRFFVL